MAFDLKQGLRLTQQLLMTPQLQQAIKLLQLSRIELEEFVSQQLSENPVLEEGVATSSEENLLNEREREHSASDISEHQMSEASRIVDKSEGELAQDFDWESYNRLKDSEAPIPSTMASKDEEQPNYENMVTKASSLTDHLMTQVGEIDFDDAEKKIAMLLIGNIDERGYLRGSIEEIAQTEDFDVELVEDVLDTIQRMDPAGVAARDLKECLLIQLRANRLKNGIVEQIISSHLGDLETRNYQGIAKALKIPIEKVIESVQIIAELEPVPARQFGGDATQYIVPDVYVFKLGDEWHVTMNDDGLPKLQVSNLYKNMVEGPATQQVKGDEKTYINEKVKSAQWLIRSIQERQRTIFKVSERIVQRQKDFFERGMEHLKPMILKDIAEDVEMHESTISRVTTNKYMHTPRGIFELKFFFNSSVATADGESVASESVRKMIGDLVKAEDNKKPISDQRIVELLEEKGVHLARRTVAKYREQLGIAPSSKRKRFF
jgi:RNA polymerase sigma-54 factor